jgi:hypothetical protein
MNELPEIIQRNIAQYEAILPSTPDPKRRHKIERLLSAARIALRQARDNDSTPIDHFGAAMEREA